MRVLHFLNQFFGGFGGEEEANLPIQVLEEPVGPGRALQQALGGQGKVIATVVSGDNYFNENREDAAAAVREAIARHRPDAVIAGPAMNAGRYGLACGAVCQIAQEAGVPAVTAMYPENPGVLEYGRQIYIIPTGETPTSIPRDIQAMARLASKLARGEEPGPAEVEGYLPRGIRKPGLREETGAVRAVKMLAARLHGRPFVTELPIEVPERVDPAPPVADLATATLGLVTTGGLVPKGNPDRLVRGGAGPEEYYQYSIEGLDTLSPDRWECVHRGFYTDIVNQNPNYILPLNVIRGIEAEGVIGRVHGKFFSTSGVGTAVGNARQIGAAIASDMKEAGVNACVMVAT